MVSHSSVDESEHQRRTSERFETSNAEGAPRKSLLRGRAVLQPGGWTRSRTVADAPARARFQRDSTIFLRSKSLRPVVGTGG